MIPLRQRVKLRGIEKHVFGVVMSKKYRYALLVTSIVVLVCGVVGFTLIRKDEVAQIKNEPVVSLWDYYGIRKKPPESLLWALWPDGFVILRSKSGELMSANINAAAVEEFRRNIQQAPLLKDETEDKSMTSYSDGLWKIIIVKHSKGQSYITRPAVTSTNPDFVAFVAKWKDFEKIINSIELSNLRPYDGSRPYAIPASLKNNRPGSYCHIRF